MGAPPLDDLVVDVVVVIVVVVVVSFIGIKHIDMFITLYNFYKVFTSVTYKQHYNHDILVREKCKMYFQNANYIDYYKMNTYVYIFHKYSLNITQNFFTSIDTVWNCLWGNTLKGSPGIIRKSRVSYPGPGFLSSATLPSLQKKDYGWLSIDAVLGRTTGLKNGVRFPRTIL